MTDYERGYDALLQGIKSFGIQMTIEVGIRTLLDYRQAILLELIINTVEHKDFYKGFRKALFDVKRKKINF